MLGGALFLLIYFFLWLVLYVELYLTTIWGNKQVRKAKNPRILLHFFGCFVLPAPFLLVKIQKKLIFVGELPSGNLT